MYKYIDINAYIYIYIYKCIYIYTYIYIFTNSPVALLCFYLIFNFYIKFCLNSLPNCKHHVLS